MTTLRDVLTRACRMTGAVGLGVTPEADELNAVMEDAQGFFLTYPVRKLTPVLITANYEAGENERITYTSGSYTVTYPTTVEDSDGTDRAPQNGAIVEVSGTSGSTRKIYIAELKTWMELTSLSLDDEQPFGPTHDLDVAAMIAVRVAASVFQQEAPPTVSAMAQQGRGNVRNAFRQLYTPNFSRALLRPEDINLEV